jgi:shikimate kinase
MRHVLLIGFMGSGKSTVGRIVAERLCMRFVDLDQLIEQREGRSIPTIFADDGEATFRAMESAALGDVSGMPPAVVACGGGIVLEGDNRAALAGLGFVAYLQVGADEALSRIGDAEGRPLLAGAETGAAAALLRSREALYEATADAVVSTAGRTPAQVAEDVVAAVSRETA